ncbi:MAG TPA: sulfurtransferase [Streptosporangiaceae bacterium]|jgi:thiosulfate/3-mercaptopyruvate sulfurtransferase
MPNRSPLIQADELAEALASDAPPVVLDVRWTLSDGPATEAYAAGHIPGAVFVDLDRDLSAPPGPEGRHPLPDPAAFQAAMRAAGVSADRPVVTYDLGDAMPAARAWWTLRYFGHPDVRVLDGGFPAWTAADSPPGTASGAPLDPAAGRPLGTAAARPLDTTVPTPAAGDFIATPGAMPYLDADGAAEVARTGLLLDARAPERYRGESEPVDPVAGHIPGAKNAPTSDDLAPNGRFHTPATLSAHYTALGASEDIPVATYCGSGVSAARELLALTIAGIPAALYVGSWSNWLATPHPVATGPEPG